MRVDRRLLLAAFMLLTGCSDKPPEIALVPTGLKGRLIFGDICASCHGAQAQGGRGPALVGSIFQSDWTGSKLPDLVRFIAREMPPKPTPVTITADDADAVARLLNEWNGMVLVP